MFLIDRPAFNRKVVEVGVAYSRAHVSRAMTPDQICNFLEFAGQARDPSISFCAAFGTYIRAHAYCDLMGIKYNSTNVVSVFKSVIPVLNTEDVHVSASCQEIKVAEHAKGKFFTLPELGDAYKFKPGWVMLFNYEDGSDWAHHYATVIEPINSQFVRTIEGNTSDFSQAHGGAVAAKARSIKSVSYRGVIVTY